MSEIAKMDSGFQLFLAKTLQNDPKNEIKQCAQMI